MINDKVRDMLVEHLNLGERPKLQDHLRDLGADSLDLEEIRIACKQEFGVELPDEFIQENITVAQLINRVSNSITK